MRRTSRASVPETSCALRNLRLRFADFFSRLWLFIAWRRRSFPAPLTLKRFFAALDVFCFGISRHSCVLRRPQDLDLGALVKEPHDVVLLGLVILGCDLRPELDLLDVDLRLVLPGELGLLLLLVPVLPVVHDPGDRRPRLRSDLDEIEVLAVGVVERLCRRLDPDLGTVLVDQPHLWNPDPLVDPRLGLRRGLGTDKPPRPQ